MLAATAPPSAGRSDRRKIPGMRITIDLDDPELLARAGRLPAQPEPAAPLRKALETLVETGRARRLALLGGTQPALKAVRRRRTVRRKIGPG